MTIRVKICGVRSVAEAEAALAAGADLVGLNFVPGSKRCLDVREAAAISRSLEGKAERVALFQDAEAAGIERILDEVAVERVQLHGDESPAFAHELGRPVIKALRGADRAAAARYPAAVLLLDHPDGRGGGGAPWAWGEARDLIEAGRDVLLAGGLRPDNVGAALASLAGAVPWGVDVASGVEDVAGQKCAVEMRAFVDAVRAVEGGGK
ncbi:MAG: phosphoribosylanthranilate isomerase [Myxococcales bacterium]|nr:phosphoribosylanthranilate isomerase [Myxococcales bacterium]